MSLESLIRHDRIVVASGLAAVTLVAWLYLLHMAREMGAVSMAAMPGMAMGHAWGARDFALTVVMWAVMMAGMMLPSAAPMVLLYAAIHRPRATAGSASAPTAVLVAGYLLVWTAFSVAATLGQWGLVSLAAVSPDTLAATPVAGGVLLIAGGIYELTPLKYACLARCRSPLGFLLKEWREGMWGALVMGIRHGLYCVGCCWMLMALLFVAGVMNLLWVAAIAAFVFMEKLVPAGRLVSRAAAAVLILWGLWVLARAL